MSGIQAGLFGTADALPEGMRYAAQFITREEEAALLRSIGELPFTEARFREYTARRRIMLYGPGVPDFLLPLRAKIAAWTGVPAGEFRQALINEYRPGTPLGWHRDAPEYGVVGGVSLGAACIMRLRPYPPRRGRNPDVISLTLEPRSAYVFRATVRWSWQHSIPPARALRYSVTLRTEREVS
ncbi:MAG: alpha-ketoglutarate-dependent dioxygenase AlkB [Betaproteobacteria bacterium]